MDTLSFNRTIVKIGKLHIGTQSRHRYKGARVFFVDFGKLNILSMKYNKAKD